MRLSATWGLSRRPLTASADESLLVARVTEATTIRQVADLTLNTFLTGPRGSTGCSCYVTSSGHPSSHHQLLEAGIVPRFPQHHRTTRWGASVHSNRTSLQASTVQGKPLT